MHCHRYPPLSKCTVTVIKMFTQAARRALLPDYAIAMLRCDSARTMRDVYDGEMPPHDWTEKVTSELQRRWFAK